MTFSLRDELSSLKDRAGSWQSVALAAVLALMMVVGYQDRGALESALTLGLGAIALTLGVFFWLGAEQRIVRLQGFSAAMTETNRLILRRPEPAALYDAICRICINSWHADGAVLDLLEGSVTRRVASSGTAKDCPATPPASWHIASRDVRQALTLQTLETGEPAVSNDAGGDPGLKTWARWCDVNSVRSVASLPLKRGGATVGALLLFSKKANFFDAALLRLLREMASDMSFALDNADREFSERKSLGQAERGQRLFRELFDLAPLPMLVFEVATRRIVRVNDLLSSVLNIGRDAIVDKSAAQLGMFDSPEAREFFHEALRLDSGVGTPVRLHSGGDRWSEVLLHSRRVDYVGTPSVLVVATDVSESRTAQVAVRARIAAEESSRAKNQFLAQMSHELRTPLNAILGFSQLLSAEANSDLDVRHTEWIQHITQAGRHLLGLVNDVLDLSRIESGKLEVVTGRVEIAPLLDEVLALSRLQAAQLRIELRAEYDPAKRVFVAADAGRLRQVLINLLSNAIKYNRAQGVVHVSLSVTAGRAHIDVTDEGLGMTEDQLVHLFEPFNRLGRQAGLIEGAGIGLALSRSLMEMMGGCLDVESTSGKGTKIRVSLPESTAATARPVRATGNRSAGRAPGAEGGATPPCGVVLYIEDNIVNQLVVEQMLMRWEGVRIELASDGATGIEMATRLQPDLVLLDMLLPDMSGADVLRALKADPGTRSLPVVALSASAMADDVATAERLGALHYWTKPLELEEFLAKMRILLEDSTLAPSETQDSSRLVS